MTEQKTYRPNHSGKMDSETVESIFIDAVRIYDSEALLKQWVGIDNDASIFNVKYWTCGGPHYQSQHSDKKRGSWWS